MKKLFTLILLAFIATTLKAQIVYKVPYQFIQYTHFHNGLLATNSSGNLFISPIISQFNPIAGSGITLSGSYPNITFTATGGGSVFNPIAGANITLTGTYPNITFNSTTFNPIAGANMAITGTYPNITFTPTVVNLTGGSNVTLSGTYPNITINASTSANSFVGVLSGGTGNGTTDDTAAINASLSAATSGVVYLKQGSTYLVTGAINVPAAVTLDLNGSKINSTASSSFIVQLTGKSSQVINGEVASKFNPTGTYTPGSGLGGINIEADSCTIDHVYLHNVQNYGILCSTGNYNYPTITNNRIVSTGYIGLYYNNPTASTSGGVLKGNLFDRSAIPASTITEGCVEIRGSSTTVLTSDWIISENRFIGAILPTASTAECIEYRFAPGGKITDNTFKYGTIGLSLVGSNKATIGNNIFYGCATGLELATDTACAVGNNVFDGKSLTGTQGVLIDGVSPFNTINGNTFRNIITNNVLVQINCSDNEINNNIFEAGASSQNIIYIKGAARIGINNNRIFGNSLSPTAIELDASNAAGVSPSDIVINGNHISDVTNVVSIFINRSVVVDGIIITSNVLKNTTTTLNEVVNGGGSVGSNVVNTNNVP